MLLNIVFIIASIHYSYGNITIESKENELGHNLTVYDLGDTLVNFINIDDTKSERISELHEKLANIKKYVVNNDELNELIMNVTKMSNLTETNFYKALLDGDDFRFMNKDENPKSLYLKLKEKLNRDDVMQILSNISKSSNFVKSANNAKNDEYYGMNQEQLINDVVDKVIAEAPKDDHNFKQTINDSIYWDPQQELEDLKDIHRPDGRRIFRGERTNIRYYPFMVSIHVMGRFWCGGVLYWHDIVLTSASCLQLLHNNRFFRENPKALAVRVGSNHSRIGGEVIEALEVYFQPGYSPKTLRNNIAIIRLRRHLYFNYHRIPKCIEISHNEEGIPATAEVMLLGWGVSKISQKMPYEPVFLQRKFLPIYPKKFCKEVYGDKFITPTMFCAGTMTTGEGACDHDAGGPAILAGKLVGIISFGPAVCGFPNAPTVFTHVGAFSDWIETINETMPPYYRGKARTTTTSESPLEALLDNWPSGHDVIDSMHHFDPVASTIKNRVIVRSNDSPDNPREKFSEVKAGKDGSKKNSTDKNTNILDEDSDGPWSSHDVLLQKISALKEINAATKKKKTPGDKTDKG